MHICALYGIKKNNIDNMIKKNKYKQCFS